jgi:hypothetical protein
MSIGSSSMSWPAPPVVSPLTTSMALFLPRAMRVYMRRRWYQFCTSITTAWNMDHHMKARQKAIRAAPQGEGEQWWSV